MLEGKKIVALSGWGQPHDSLRTLLPEAIHFDYSAHPSPEHIFAALAKAAEKADLVVGWSQGGQLALRAAANGLIRPRRLALLAAPYQFVENTVPGLGMKRPMFEQFRANLARDPARTLKKAWALVAHQDAREAEITQALAEIGANMPARDWLKWLDTLAHFSCEALEWNGLPPTLIVHGVRDAVVRVNQAQAFATKMPQASVHIWNECGHAPHLHDAARLRALLEEHVR